MIFNNPISVEKADRVVRMLELPSGGRALDVGCGTGEFLLRVIASHGVDGVGIDLDLRCITAARAKAEARGFSSRCEFHLADANDFATGPGGFDLGICIGSTHAFGAGESAYPSTITRLGKLVRAGGFLLIGEGYWKREPATEYLNLLGDPPGIYRDHTGNVALAEAVGLIPLYATVSSEDEWDHFEWSHQQKIRREAEASPNDVALAERLGRSRHWRDGYMRWGRSTMGFGLYLFRLPGGE